MRKVFGFIILTIILFCGISSSEAAWVWDAGQGYAELQYSSPIKSGSTENSSWHVYGEQGIDPKNTLLYQFTRYNFSDNSSPASAVSGWGDYKIGIRHQTMKYGNRADSLELEYSRPIGYETNPAARTYLQNPELEVRYDWSWGSSNYFGSGYRQIRLGYSFVDGAVDRLNYKFAIDIPVMPKTGLLLALEGYRSTNGLVFDHWFKVGGHTRLNNNSVLYVNRFVETSKSSPKGSNWQAGMALTY